MLSPSIFDLQYIKKLSVVLMQTFGSSVAAISVLFFFLGGAGGFSQLCVLQLSANGTSTQD